MKLFYSRTHALKFLKVQADTLHRAVTKNWIREMRFGPHGEGHFFLRSDLVEFREKYRSGYFDLAATLRRKQEAGKLRARGGD